MTSKHIVLAGDSIFDNDGYVPGETGVIEQMRMSIPATWSASKIAVDGDCIQHVAEQLECLPSNATDLVVSVGGNDARQHTHLFDKIAESQSMEALLAAPLNRFRASYRDMLARLINTKLSVQTCTIYTEIPFPDPVWRQLAPQAIKHFNDIIIDESESVGVSVLRLDIVCTLEQDFSKISPIEPSSQGGQKIVNHILASLK